MTTGQSPRELRRIHGEDAVPQFMYKKGMKSTDYKEYLRKSHSKDKVLSKSDRSPKNLKGYDKTEAKSYDNRTSSTTKTDFEKYKEKAGPTSLHLGGSQASAAARPGSSSLSKHKRSVSDGYTHMLNVKPGISQNKMSKMNKIREIEHKKGLMHANKIIGEKTNELMNMMKKMAPLLEKSGDYSLINKHHPQPKDSASTTSTQRSSDKNPIQVIPPSFHNPQYKGSIGLENIPVDPDKRDDFKNYLDYYKKKNVNNSAEYRLYTQIKPNPPQKYESQSSSVSKKSATTSNSVAKLKQGNKSGYNTKENSIEMLTSPGITTENSIIMTDHSSQLNGNCNNAQIEQTSHSRKTSPSTQNVNSINSLSSNSQNNTQNINTQSNGSMTTDSYHYYSHANTSTANSNAISSTTSTAAAAAAATGANYYGVYKNKPSTSSNIPSFSTANANSAAANKKKRPITISNEASVDMISKDQIKYNKYTKYEKYDKYDKPEHHRGYSHGKERLGKKTKPLYQKKRERVNSSPLDKKSNQSCEFFSFFLELEPYKISVSVPNSKIPSSSHSPEPTVYMKNNKVESSPQKLSAKSSNLGSTGIGNIGIYENDKKYNYEKSGKMHRLSKSKKVGRAISQDSEELNQYQKNSSQMRRIINPINNINNIYNINNINNMPLKQDEQIHIIQVNQNVTNQYPGSSAPSYPSYSQYPSQINPVSGINLPQSSQKPKLIKQTQQQQHSKYGHSSKTNLSQDNTNPSYHHSHSQSQSQTQTQGDAQLSSKLHSEHNSSSSDSRRLKKNTSNNTPAPGLLSSEILQNSQNPPQSKNMSANVNVNLVHNSPKQKELLGQGGAKSKEIKKSLVQPAQQKQTALLSYENLNAMDKANSALSPSKKKNKLLDDKLKLIQHIKQCQFFFY